jgi:hypothetical protein
MSWIKRNLYFVIFSAVAVALLGLSGWYFYANYQRNNDMVTKLNGQYERLQQLNNEKPHPGKGSINNIETAKEQRAQLTNYLQQVRRYFTRIPAIPDMPKVEGRDFTAALHGTLDKLQRAAQGASITLPPEGGGYSFSFTAEKSRVSFTGGLDALAVQLGEVKALSDVLFQANINALDFLKRERVSPDDIAGTVTDYVPETPTTNELAVMSHYEMTFRCFSSELASVLAGFASSPHGIIVKTINVEQASAAPMGMGMGGFGEGAPGMVQPGMGQPGMGPPGAGQPGMGQPPGVPGQPTPETPAGGRGGLPTVLDEKQLRITLGVVIVKLLPPK